MMKYLRADILFLISAVVCLGLGIFIPSGPDTVIDINVHDTYFVIAQSHVYMGIAVIFGLMALFQFLLLRGDSKAMRVLSIVNWCFIVLPFALIILLLELYVWPLKGRYYQQTAFDLDWHLGAVAWMLLFGLCVFLIEIVMSAFLLMRGKLNK